MIIQHQTGLINLIDRQSLTGNSPGPTQGTVPSNEGTFGRRDCPKTKSHRGQCHKWHEVYITFRAKQKDID